MFKPFRQSLVLRHDSLEGNGRIVRIGWIMEFVFPVAALEKNKLP
jgi:hypothetical protein